MTMLTVQIRSENNSASLDHVTEHNTTDYFKGETAGKSNPDGASVKHGSSMSKNQGHQNVEQ
jgi:hypothetical protein